MEKLNIIALTLYKRGRCFFTNNIYVLVFVVVLGCKDIIALANPVNIDKNCKITTSIYEGIRATKSCKIAFNNSQDIIIGDMYNNRCPGIEISPGITLIIQIRGCGNINVYGGSLNSWDNGYSYAGIYVPTGATLVIEGNKTGVLNALGYLGAAGIGGCGVAMKSRDMDYSMINAGSIYIKSGTIVASSSCSCFNNSFGGVGAGIGGGGVFNAIDRENLIGGSLDFIEISGGNVTAMGGGCTDCDGIGAGIGGGGVCNIASKVGNIRGGNLNKIRIAGGVITARGGSNNNIKGLGAGIGGGGIFNEKACPRIYEGQLIEFENIKDERLNAASGYKDGADIGSGSVNCNNTCIKGSLPVYNLDTEFIGVRDVLAKSRDKIFSTILMFFAGIIVMIGK
ncbi:MAG: hypothetical protein J6Y29_04205 [Clostridiales bacterium]|nr:hypothetical protein [Clostridiales bacterium]